MVENEFTKPDIERCALISIDMQNDFVLPEGSVHTPGADTMLPALQALAGKLRETRKPIVHIVRLYSQDGSNAEPCRRQDLIDGKQIVVPGTAGAELAEGLLPEGVELDADLISDVGVQGVAPAEVILYKPSWSAFFNTRLHDMLQSWDVNTALVAGTWFANCVRQTIYDAIALDYRVVAVRDCIAGITDKDQIDLEKVGCVVLNSSELSSLSL